MALFENIYESLDPFTKYPVLVSQHYPASHANYQLRPLCLRTDLQVIYDWLNNPSHLSNLHTNVHKLTALFFHKIILESVNGQSLLVTRNDKPIALWTITPAQFDPCLSKYDPDVQDKTMEFLMNVADETLFQQSLDVCLQFCSLGKSSGRLYICINSELSKFLPILLRTGFKQIATSETVFNGYWLTLPKP